MWLVERPHPFKHHFPRSLLSFWQGKSILMFCNLPNLANILYCHTYNTEDETEIKEFKEPQKEAEKEKIELAGMFNDLTTWYPLETSQQYTMLVFHNDTSKLLYYIKDYSTMKQCPNSKSECLWKHLHLSKESLHPNRLVMRGSRRLINNYKSSLYSTEGNIKRSP